MTGWDLPSVAAFDQSWRPAPAPTARAPHLGPQEHLVVLPFIPWSFGLGSEDQFKKGPIQGFPPLGCVGSPGECSPWPPGPLQAHPSPVFSISPPARNLPCSAGPQRQPGLHAAHEGLPAAGDGGCVCVRPHSTRSSRPKGPGMGWGPHQQGTPAGQLWLKPRFTEGETEAQSKLGGGRGSPELTAPWC